MLLLKKLCDCRTEPTGIDRYNILGSGSRFIGLAVLQAFCAWNLGREMKLLPKQHGWLQATSDEPRLRLATAKASELAARNQGVNPDETKLANHCVVLQQRCISCDHDKEHLFCDLLRRVHSIAVTPS